MEKTPINPKKTLQNQGKAALFRLKKSGFSKICGFP